MTIHHLDCGSMCPLIVGRMVCHCLLVESNEGLILIDAGLGMRDVTSPSETLPRAWRLLTRPRFDASQTALAQVRALGYQAEDVRHIVLTHLDLDHAGGISDFPNATVHVHAREKAAALSPVDAKARNRYRAAHFAHGPRWQTYSEEGETWFGFGGIKALGDAGRELLDGELLLIPLFGHTEGHMGIALRQGGQWLLHAGDAFFHHNEIEGKAMPRLLGFFEKRVQTLATERVANTQRLAELAQAHGGEVRIINAHDASYLDTALDEAVQAPRPRVQLAPQ